MEKPRDYFNQEDYDRWVKAGVTKFVGHSSLPDPDEYPELYPDVDDTVISPPTQTSGPNKTQAMEQTSISIPELLANEKLAWKDVLGVDVEIKPLPDFVTQEVRKDMETFGLKLLYLPSLDCGSLDHLKIMGVNQYLKSLENNYPSWRIYDKMSPEDQMDYRVSRTLGSDYWDLLKKRKFIYPEILKGPDYKDSNMLTKLPGQWVAVEKMPKPKYGMSYERTPIGVILGFWDRLNVSWQEAKNAIQRNYELGGRFEGILRMPEALEWNLMANREGWGATDTAEWNNTEFSQDSEGRNRISMGRLRDGGAAEVTLLSKKDRSGRLGFRVGVFLNT